MLDSTKTQLMGGIIKGNMGIQICSNHIVLISNMVILNFLFDISKTNVKYEPKICRKHPPGASGQHSDRLKWFSSDVGLDARNMSSGFVTNKGADQPAHLRRLVSTFVIHFLESITSKLASHEI